MRKILLMMILSALMLPVMAGAAPLSLDDMTAAVNGAAQFTIEGMDAQAYEEAVRSSENWVEIVRAESPEPLLYDISRRYEWSDIEQYLLAMSSHTVAKVYAMGETTGGRRIYSVCIGTGEKCVMLTGGLHAKEPAGTSYILRLLGELISDLESGDERAVSLLEQYRIVAVPCCNPDGRAILEADEATDWRANGSGVDLGCNFPTSNAGQLSPDAHQAYHATEPGASDYPGLALGSETETRILIGWLNKYIDSAAVFCNLEQYGRYIHTVSSYMSEDATARSNALAFNLQTFLSREDASYTLVPEDEPMRGWGAGSILEYASELAEGLSFCPEYGRMGLKLGSAPKPLCLYGDIDAHAEAYAPRNDTVAMVTVELSTKGGAAYYENARRNHLKEYQNCGYEELLYHLMEYGAAK